MIEKEIWDKAYKRIFELYGNVPDLRIVSRYFSEKQAFKQYEVGDIPATRDEVFMTIREAMRDCDFYDTGFAFDVANKARRGHYHEHGMDDYTNQTLSMLGFDDWFGSFIRITHYMSTKAFAVLELKYSIILNWYRVYYPRGYQQIMTDYNA